jgi:biopolymer transport protein ExbD
MRYLMMACVALFALAVPVRADEEKVPLDKVPKAVKDAATKRFPKAEVVGASKETADSKTVYEIELKLENETIDVTVTPEGTLTLIEKQIDAKNLPKAVADTLGTKYPKATYKIIEEVIKVADGKESLDFYEVLIVTADKKMVEVQIAADGKIKKVEEK